MDFNLDYYCPYLGLKLLIVLSSVTSKPLSVLYCLISSSPRDLCSRYTVDSFLEIRLNFFIEFCELSLYWLCYV